MRFCRSIYEADHDPIVFMVSLVKERIPILLEHFGHRLAMKCLLSRTPEKNVPIRKRRERRDVRLHHLTRIRPNFWAFPENAQILGLIRLEFEVWEDKTDAT
jgi:hypothetical protein